MNQQRNTQQAAVRGVILVVVLAALGGLIVNKGFHSKSGKAASGPSATTSLPANQSTTTLPLIPTTSIPPTTVAPPAGTTKVLVVNGSTGVKGAASRIADTLIGKGFSVVGKLNALSKQTVAVTVVYYLEGYAAQADSVAATIASATITPKSELMPAQLPVKKADLGEAQVLVLLGKDLAQ
jgi:hypothetical protein